MADVRALLKAKRQEVKISHPLASYNHNNQLRCIACGILVKHASAWEGHLGSKAHRTNVVRLREEEKAREIQMQQEEMARKSQGKRKVEDDGGSDSESNEGEAKRRRVGDATLNGMPEDFFSDSSRVPLPPASDSSEDEGEINVTATTEPPPPAAAPTVIDHEYERFQREVLSGSDQHETYERATVFAEPEIVVDRVSNGFPGQEADDDQRDLSEKLNEEAARRQKEQDERELIMDRLLDEERAQEEADMRVLAMKARFEALKKKREVAKATKNKLVS